MKHCSKTSIYWPCRTFRQRALLLMVVGWLSVIGGMAQGRAPADSLSHKGVEGYLRTLLQPIREGLKSGNSVVEVIHLGDSHTQSGYLTQVIRERLQAKYGDAGRGWLTPYKMARTNQLRLQHHFDGEKLEVGEDQLCQSRTSRRSGRGRPHSDTEVRTDVSCLGAFRDF
ncbi:hypothetical protein [Porphyromonas cangingivalis]|uniref:hypothetical protein n=1 Tax=Porphyromonas cangingivalis TaxID=36874 RepID=UPI00047134DD|nr:hypothetical protein [Porphyromonas cangingivalis]